MENGKIIMGRVIRIARIANDYTIKEASELAQVSGSYITEVEHGKKKMSVKTFENLAKTYNLASFQLMELVEYYESLDVEDLKKYQLTLIKVLEILLGKTS